MGNGFQVQDRFADGCAVHRRTAAPRHVGPPPGRGGPGDGRRRSCATNSRATDDVDAAVAAAREAFPGWSGADPGRALGRAAPLRRRTRRAGRGLRVRRVPPVRQAAQALHRVRRPRHRRQRLVLRGGRPPPRRASRPPSTAATTPPTYAARRIGVVGSIAPWNYPLQMAAWKVLPAVAAGNTIVLKPAEITPLTSLMFAQAATEAGIPDGVINIVSGAGRDAGEHLVGHPDVVMTSFTGSTAVGKRVAEIATATVKRLHLELGGKAPFLVFDDADLEAAVHGAVAGRAHQHRPGLHGRHPRLRPAPALRRLRERGRRPDGERAARRPLRPVDRPRTADQPRSSATGSPDSSTAPAPTPPSSPAARPPAASSPTVPTTGRP